ncbi:MAG: DNA-processing protein DprA [Firmicutes bacterium]|nr:DNA-processing protein DprA [Bacillota bacterium]
MKRYTKEERACIAISRAEDAGIRRRLVEDLYAGRFDKILEETDRMGLENLVKNMHEQGIFVVTIHSPEYPKALLDLESAPIALFCMGNVELLKKPAVAMVGMRSCTRYGKEVATRFGREFASKGIVVVSGLAEGIDTASHEGAISAVGEDRIYNTIAVLGNGLNIYFPARNRELQQKIGKHGLVISEYLPNAPSAKFTFPYRNRIVAALSKAVVIVEADLKSGTMITREWALELGRDVYAVPGPITSVASRGTNAIIKDASCAIITDVNDVLQSFGVVKEDKMGAEKTFVQLSFDEKVIMDIIGSDEVHFDEIIEKSNMSVKNATTLLTNMEMSGLIEKLAGNQFVAK